MWWGALWSTPYHKDLEATSRQQRARHRGPQSYKPARKWILPTTTWVSLEPTLLQASMKMTNSMTTARETAWSKGASKVTPKLLTQKFEKKPLNLGEICYTALDNWYTSKESLCPLLSALCQTPFQLPEKSLGRSVQCSASCWIIQTIPVPSPCLTTFLTWDVTSPLFNMPMMFIPPSSPCIFYKI